jgi:hypothetical protein
MISTEKLKKIRDRYKLIASYHQLQRNYGAEMRYIDLYRFVEWLMEHSEESEVPGIAKSLNPDFYGSDKKSFYQKEINKTLGVKK